jgi:hypothetical protein
MKKEYIKPQMGVVSIQQSGVICTSITGISSNTGLVPGNGGSEQGRAPELFEMQQLLFD